MLVHELVPWWLFYYDFKHFMEERIHWVAAPRECALEKRIFLLNMLSVEIIFSREKILTRGNYEKGLEITC